MIRMRQTALWELAWPVDVRGRGSACTGLVLRRGSGFYYIATISPIPPPSPP